MGGLSGHSMQNGGKTEVIFSFCFPSLTKLGLRFVVVWIMSHYLVTFNQSRQIYCSNILAAIP